MAHCASLVANATSEFLIHPDQQLYRQCLGAFVDASAREYASHRAGRGFCELRKRTLTFNPKVQLLACFLIERGVAENCKKVLDYICTKDFSSLISSVLLDKRTSAEVKCAFYKGILRWESRLQGRKLDLNSITVQLSDCTTPPPQATQFLIRRPNLKLETLKCRLISACYTVNLVNDMMDCTETTSSRYLGAIASLQETYMKMQGVVDMLVEEGAMEILEIAFRVKFTIEQTMKQHRAQSAGNGTKGNWRLPSFPALYRFSSERKESESDSDSKLSIPHAQAYQTQPSFGN